MCSASPKLIRIIAEVKMTTPTEANVVYCMTLKNEAQTQVEVYKFPRPRNMYFQRLEVLDAGGRYLEVLKQGDPRCGEGYVCILLSPPMKPGEQRTIIVRCAMVPEPKIEGRLIKHSTVRFVVPVGKNLTAYLHVLPPRRMVLAYRGVEENVEAFYYQPPVGGSTSRATREEVSELATPKMGSRYVSLRFKPSQDAVYIVKLGVEYPRSLRLWLLCLLFTGALWAAYKLLLPVLSRLTGAALPQVTATAMVTLMGALVGTRIWLFEESLMKALSYAYLVVLLLMMASLML